MAVLIVMIVFSAKAWKDLQTYKSLAMYPNQACVGVGIAIKDGLQLNHYDFEARSLAGSDKSTVAAGLIGQHKCTIGTVITDEIHNPDGSGSGGGYQLSSDILYFKSANNAYAFADKVENPRRSWSVDEAGVKRNIPQTSLFTYIVTNVKEPYFEAYTVRDKSVLSISLPCNLPVEQDLNAVYDQCNKDAQHVLRDYANSVQQTLSRNTMFK